MKIEELHLTRCPLIGSNLSAAEAKEIREIAEAKLDAIVADANNLRALIIKMKEIEVAEKC